MKRIVILLIFLSFIGNLSASPISFTETYDAGHQKINWLSTAFWEFDLIDDGFNPTVMEITEASIDLVIVDDNDIWWECGLFIGEKTTEWIWKAENTSVDLNLSSLDNLNTDGKIDCSLTSTFGDFYLNSATLCALGSESVPEPSDMALLITGTLLLGLTFRKRLNLSKRFE